MYSLTREASQHIDAYLPRHLHVPLELLMENAGRGIADALVDVEGNRFHEDPFTGMVLFVCGVGNNGADGLVAARHLMEQGIPVSIALVGDLTNSLPWYRPCRLILSHLKVLMIGLAFTSL